MMNLQKRAKTHKIISQVAILMRILKMNLSRTEERKRDINKSKSVTIIMLIIKGKTSMRTKKTTLLKDSKMEAIIPLISLRKSKKYMIMRA